MWYFQEKTLHAVFPQKSYIILDKISVADVIHMFANHDIEVMVPLSTSEQQRVLNKCL